MKVILIEDEFNAIEALKKILRYVAPSLEIVGQTGLVSEAITLIINEKPDLVFLDIQLEDGTAFNILDAYNNIDFKIIFTTAYNQHAIKAFKYSAIDYLLKPIDPSELKEAIEKASKLVTTQKEHTALLENLKTNLEAKNKKITLKTTDRTYYVDMADIIRLEADGAYTNFVTLNNEILISKNLKYYQDLLDDNFIRCHQSHLVNKLHVISLLPNNSLVLTNQNSIPVSSRKKAEVKQLISK